MVSKVVGAVARKMKLKLALKKFGEYSKKLYNPIRDALIEIFRRTYSIEPQMNAKEDTDLTIAKITKSALFKVTVLYVLDNSNIVSAVAAIHEDKDFRRFLTLISGDNLERLRVDFDRNAPQILRSVCTKYGIDPDGFSFTVSRLPMRDFDGDFQGYGHYEEYLDEEPPQEPLALPAPAEIDYRVYPDEDMPTVAEVAAASQEMLPAVRPKGGKGDSKLAELPGFVGDT
jgi:hypothetical protein